MYNEDIRLAIDVGSSKVCSVVIRRDNYNEPEILAIDVLPSESIHDGDVMNRSEATAAVRTSVEEGVESVLPEIQQSVRGLWWETRRFLFGVGESQWFRFRNRK